MERSQGRAGRTRATSKNARPFLLLLLALLPLAACASGGSSNPLDAADRRSNEIEILVDNQNFNQVTVYTARGASFQRLGIVQGKSRHTFKTDWYHPDIQLRVKFLTGPDLLTDSQPVSPGELLELIIPAR